MTNLRQALGDCTKLFFNPVVFVYQDISKTKLIVFNKGSVGAKQRTQEFQDYFFRVVPPVYLFFLGQMLIGILYLVGRT